MDRFFKIYPYLLLVVVILFSLYLRYEDIKFWKANERDFFYKGEPLYSEYDSFYFARFALDMKEGLYKYGAIDHFRLFPDNTTNAKLSEKETFYSTYPLAGVFISHIFYFLSKITGMSVAWLTYYLIPIFATTVVLPLFFYFNRLHLPFAGILSGLVAVSAPMYLGRTCLMRLDHDVFNLTLPFSIAYFFYRFFETNQRESKLFWITLASLFMLFYQLWYAHPNLNFVLLLTFLVIFFWEPVKNLFIKRNKTFTFSKEDFIFLAILILPQLWYIYEGPYHLFQQVATLVFNIKSPTSIDILFKDFPNIFISISELSRLSFEEALASVVFNKILGIIGLIGAILLFIFNFKKLFFLLPFFGIGCLVFFSGARFSMYLSPFIGIGLGFLVHFLFEKLFPYLDIFREKHKQRLVLALMGILLFVVVIITQREAIGMVCTPKVDAELVKDMEWIKEHTPKNAVIWSWWDYGYAFQLYARRAVFHDGGSQTSPKTYFIARSFSTSDPREAWLITSFVSNYGLTGLTKIMKNGLSAEEVVESIKRGEFAKPINTPIYWVFTQDLIPKFGWIHYFGTYEFKRKEGTFGRILTPICKVKTPTLLECPELEGATIDLNNGLIHLRNGSAPIKEIYHYDEQQRQLQKKDFYPQGYTLEIVRTKNNQIGLFLVIPPSEKTLFNEMFILRKYDPRYFELVYDNFPNMVVYKVKPE